MLNVPYFFIPIIGGAKFLDDRPKQLLTSDQVSLLLDKILMSKANLISDH